MSHSEKPVSQWKLMLVGSSSVVVRRLFIAALSVVSLAVWTVTVIGTGILHGGGTPTEAAASLTLGTTDVPPSKKGEAAGGETGGGAVTAAGQAIEMPLRDPFTASAVYFPRPKSATAGGEKSSAGELPGQGTAADEGSSLTPDKLVLLQVEGTLLGGRDKTAIVRGNCIKIDGQLKVLVAVAADGQGGAESVSSLAGSAGRHLRAGDQIEVRSAALAQNRYVLSEQREALKVKDITHRGFSFTLANKDYVLEMGK